MVLFIWRIFYLPTSEGMLNQLIAHLGLAVEIVEPNFATGDLTGWFGAPQPSGDPSLALVEVVGEQLHMRVANNYVYDSGLGWQLQEPDYSAAVVLQNGRVMHAQNDGVDAERLEHAYLAAIDPQP